jgi:hypothetical protein
VAWLGHAVGLAYIHLVDHSPMGAPPVPDSIKATFRSEFKRALILSGGSGTRLWPVSRRAYPKQLLPLAGDGSLVNSAGYAIEGDGGPISTNAQRIEITASGEIIGDGSPVDRLAIRCSSPAQLVSNLSGGNQQKVALAKWLLSGAKVLVRDEPTRGVDVGARQEIYRIIRELAADGVAVVVVSSDLPEILAICERVIVMHEGRVTGTLKASELSEAKVMYYATDVQALEKGA